MQTMKFSPDMMATLLRQVRFSTSGTATLKAIQRSGMTVQRERDNGKVDVSFVVNGNTSYRTFKKNDLVNA